MSIVRNCVCKKRFCVRTHLWRILENSQITYAEGVIKLDSLVTSTRGAGQIHGLPQYVQMN